MNATFGVWAAAVVAVVATEVVAVVAWVAVVVAGAWVAEVVVLPPQAESPIANTAMASTKTNIVGLAFT
jgi:hypothetical protein